MGYHCCSIVFICPYQSWGGAQRVRVQREVQTKHFGTHRRKRAFYHCECTFLLIKGSPSLKPERLPEPVPVCGGNAISPDLIRLQPGPAAAAPAAAQGPQRPQSRPGCPQCGLQTPKNLRGPGGSSLSVRSSKSKKSQRSKGGSKTTLNQPAENAPGDVCFDLLLSCLFCHCSALLLGLLDLCSSGFSSLCSGCAGGCADCCSAAVQDVPAEELSCHTHCHSVLVQSCCEPTEFLEFCLECCQICHRS